LVPALCGGAKIFGSAYYSQRAVFACLGALFSLLPYTPVACRCSYWIHHRRRRRQNLQKKLIIIII